MLGWQLMSGRRAVSAAWAGPGRASGLLLAIAAVAFAAGAAAAASPQQKYYKWTDAQGTVHFSAQPPQGRKAKVVDVKGDARSEPPPQPAAQPTDELEQAEAEYRRQSCEAARNDLKLLASGQMVVQGDSAATATKLNAEQRTRATTAAKARVDQFCTAK
jgi:hypothetical protein